ncbi:MAG: peroxiredoxin [Planctomycetota bacterium]
MLTLGQRFPDYRLKGVVSIDSDADFESFDNARDGDRWKIFVFYPKDFTFVCPTELAAFGKLTGDFADRDAALYGVSTDSEFVHLAWRRDHDDLRDLPYPLLSDTARRLSGALGVLEPEEEVCHRATYIVDPAGVVRFAAIYDPSVGRSADEVLRVLDALQTEELCPCNWQRGEETLKAG